MKTLNQQIMSAKQYAYIQYKWKNKCNRTDLEKGCVAPILITNWWMLKLVFFTKEEYSEREIKL